MEGRVESAAVRDSTARMRLRWLLFDPRVYQFSTEGISRCPFELGPGMGDLVMGQKAPEGAFVGVRAGRDICAIV